jgi:osmotically-inducible protein OsmY
MMKWTTDGGAAAKEERMNKSETMLLGVALGAGLVYFLDPDKGNRRRALLRDRFIHAGHELEDAAGAGARHVRNRSLGLMHEAKAGLMERGVDDRVLEERVRSEMGRTVSNAGSILVSADDGVVTLSGEVPSAEVQDLVRRVRAVRGVHRVENQLSVHTHAESVPVLEGTAVEGSRNA